MSGSLFGLGLRIEAAVRRKVFVSYHHGGDQAYYNTFSQAFHDAYDVITDNSLERAVDSGDVEYVMRRIREDCVRSSSCTIVLVGRETHLRKYIDWEIKATPSLPINSQGRVSVPARLSDNINTGYALWLSWADITANAHVCQRYIEVANSKDKRLIDNSRARRLHNG